MVALVEVVEVDGVLVHGVPELVHIKREGPSVRLEHGQHDAVELEPLGDALQQTHHAAT